MEKKKVVYKNAFINQISSKCSIDIKDVSKVLETMQQVLLDNINDGFGIKINGFLSFEIIELAQRVGIDSETGKKIQLPSQKRVNVKVSDSYQKKINQTQ